MSNDPYTPPTAPIEDVVPETGLPWHMIAVIGASGAEGAIGADWRALCADQARPGGIRPREFVSTAVEFGSHPDCRLHDVSPQPACIHSAGSCSRSLLSDCAAVDATTHKPAQPAIRGQLFFTISRLFLPIPVAAQPRHAISPGLHRVLPVAAQARDAGLKNERKQAAIQSRQ